MIISVASGKGGTGKTTVATSLAAVLGLRAQLIDCDVEEPNCHLLMRPVLDTRRPVSLPVPQVDMSKCNLCEKCGQVCQFSAILVIGKEVLTFPEMCHGCGGCGLFCPEGAITETEREIGVIEAGKAGEVEFVHGLLRVGEAMSPPLIRAVKSMISPDKAVILDAPPGASCPVINTVIGSDVILMVTEPTPFGLHDLRIAVDAVKELGIPLGVVINRSDIGDDGVIKYCQTTQIPILMQIPHRRAIAEGYSSGKLLIDAAPEFRDRFLGLYDMLTDLSKGVSGLGGPSHA